MSTTLAPSRALRASIQMVDAWYGCPIGKTRHAVQKRADASACGIERDRFTRAMPSPMEDGRYHLMCQTCLGKLARYVEINGMNDTQRLLIMPPNAKFDLKDWRK